MDETENSRGKSAIDYIKENHSWIIACASGIIAVLLFLAGSFAYICQKIMLQEYKIPVEYIDITKHGQFFYSVIASFGYYLISGLLQLRLVSIIRYYYEYSALKTYGDAYYEKHAQKNIEKEISLLAETKKDLRRETIRKVIFLLFSLYISYIIFMQVVSTLNGMTLLLGLIITTTIFFFAISRAKKEAGDSSPSKVKRNLFSVKSEAKEEIKTQKSEKYYDYALIRVLQNITKKRDFEETLPEHIIVAGASILISFIAVTGSAFIDAKTKDTFPIYTDNDKQYVLVYQNSDIRVFEEANIDDTSIEILLDKQRYVVSDDVELKIQKFREVKKINGQEDQSNVILAKDKSPFEEVEQGENQ